MTAYASEHTTLNEVARAVSELSDERSFYGGYLVSPEEELKALSDLFREHAEQVGKPANDDLCRHVAAFVLEAMVTQDEWRRTTTARGLAADMLFNSHQAARWREAGLVLRSEITEGWQALDGDVRDTKIGGNDAPENVPKCR